MTKKINFPVFLIIFLITLSCQKKNNNDRNTMAQDSTQKEGSFGYDLAFLQKHKPVILLTAPDDKKSQVIVIAEYQGRVMTSTADGDAGNSYGWINYDLISTGHFQPHMNAFGGEERFWLSPEGGQFSVFFKKGQKFDFENWQTPALIDTVAFKMVQSDSSSAGFQVHAVIENYSGTTFNVEIDREISVLDKKSILEGLNITSLGNCKSIAYESVNSIMNKGAAWKTETGTLGIWLLGMFRPSEKTMIVAPFTSSHSQEPLITDDYFGKIPADRFIVRDSAVFLKADGKYRSKIGISPRSARNVAGSYDAEKGILTIIQYDLDPDGKYLKSSWEIHKNPYSGDALNVYNDGKLSDGTQMGPFYELESSSSTQILKQGEKLTHRQRTYHFEGDKAALSQISKKVLGINIDQIVEFF